jgi:transcription-repair coupling factor (superfamily II helicase)
MSHRNVDEGCVFICGDESKAERVGAVIHAFDQSSGVMVLPGLHASPVDDLEPSREIAGRRSSVLRRLADNRSGLVITTLGALIRRVPPAQALLASSLRLRLGDAFDEAAIRAALIDGGYVIDDPIDMPGMALFLGPALEIFPAGGLSPVRVSHDNGTITKIYTYDLADGRDIDEAGDVAIDVINECNDNGDARRPCSQTLFDYLPRARVICDYGTPDHSESRLRITQQRNGESASASLFLTRSEWQAHIEADNATILRKPAEQPSETFSTTAAPGRKLRKYLAEHSSERRRIVFTTATPADLKAMDRRAGGTSVLCKNWSEAEKASQDGRSAALADLDRGFVSSDGRVVVVTATDVLGSRTSHLDIMSVVPRRGFRDAPLSFGDVVVHMDRGLARLRELVAVSATGVADAEMVKLEFADDEAMLVGLSELRSIGAMLPMPKASGSTRPTA